MYISQKVAHLGNKMRKGVLVCYLLPFRTGKKNKLKGGGRVKGISPTQRTLKAIREQGRLCGIVERYIAHAGPFGKRVDLFGFIDIIAIDPVDGIVAVQSCGSSFSDHIKKMTGERNEMMFEWLKYAKVELWGWRKVKLERGGKAERWRPRVADFRLEGGQIVWQER